MIFMILKMLIVRMDLLYLYNSRNIHLDLLFGFYSWRDQICWGRGWLGSSWTKGNWRHHQIRWVTPSYDSGWDPRAKLDHIRSNWRKIKWRWHFQSSGSISFFHFSAHQHPTLQIPFPQIWIGLRWCPCFSLWGGAYLGWMGCSYPFWFPLLFRKNCDGGESKKH